MKINEVNVAQKNQIESMKTSIEVLERDERPSTKRARETSNIYSETTIDLNTPGFNDEQLTQLGNILSK